jgi:hypothetical protein
MGVVREFSDQFLAADGVSAATAHYLDNFRPFWVGRRISRRTRTKAGADIAIESKHGSLLLPSKRTSGVGHGYRASFNVLRFMVLFLAIKGADEITISVADVALTYRAVNSLDSIG